jgi:hypothetical protein
VRPRASAGQPDRRQGSRAEAGTESQLDDLWPTRYASAPRRPRLHRGAVLAWRSRSTPTPRSSASSTACSARVDGRARQLVVSTATRSRKAIRLASTTGLGTDRSSQTNRPRRTDSLPPSSTWPGRESDLVDGLFVSGFFGKRRRAAVGRTFAASRTAWQGPTTASRSSAMAVAATIQRQPP